MTTPITLVVCTAKSSASALTLGQQCPTASRLVISTTVEQLTEIPNASVFDPAFASSVWSLAFTSVVGLYLVSKHAGVILALIRGR